MSDEADIAAELAKQVAALKRDKKAMDDKKIKQIATDANDLQFKINKMAVDRKRLEGDRGADPAEIKGYNDTLPEVVKAALAVSKLCQPFRGKDTTPAPVIKVFDMCQRVQRFGMLKAKV